jgi:aspartyl/asparaginyl beta-hydroxylase (cupin superfamily)
MLDERKAEQLVRSGYQALQTGDVREARRRFEQITQTGRANAQIWLLLATACRADGDVAAEEAALDQVLAIEPGAVRAHIMKADCRLKAGDEPGALRFYRSGLLRADKQRLPPDLLAEVRRAEAAVDEIRDRFELRNEALLSQFGLPPENRSRRFQHALDISAGRKKVFMQEPTAFFYPELPHVQFYDLDHLEWVKSVEEATGAIRGELIGLLERNMGDFRPYIEDGPNLVRRDTIMSELVDNPGWSTLFLCENGKVSSKLIERCPKTWEAVQRAPLATVATWGPTVMFSLLRAGTRIVPHTGMVNTRLICHLPLIVPPKCRFRVGNEVREWQVGKLLVFDDTVEHEAWNDSDEDRVILIFDIWRPELCEREVKELSILYGECRSRLHQGSEI